MVETQESILAGETGDAVIIDGVTIAPLKKMKEDSIVRKLSMRLKESLSPEEWEGMKKLEVDASDFEKIKLFLNGLTSVRVYDEIQSVIEKERVLASNQVGVRGKDRSKALLFKDAGNKAFARGNNEIALNYYSLAAAWMPILEDSENKGETNRDVSIIYGNRSAALFYLHEYTLALNDIEFAFWLNYPQELQYKLHERSGRCHLQLGRADEAIGEFQKALKVIIAMTPGDDKLVKAKSSVEDLLKRAQHGKKTQCCVDKIDSDEDMRIPEIDGGAYLQCGTKKLRVESSEKTGRYIRAVEDIGPGELILVEKAFVSFLTPEKFHQQCLQCFIPLRAPIFCSSCNQVSYCSLQCWKESTRTHHRFECEVLDILKRSEISITCYMAFRAVTKAGLREVLQWFDLISEEKLGKLANKDQDSSCGEVYKTDASCLFQLVTHSHRRNREDLFSRIIMSLYLLQTLKFTQFFYDYHEENVKNGANEKEMYSEAQVKVIGGWNESELKTAAVIMRLLQLFQFNAHSIGGWGQKEGNSVFLGGGLFPSLSLFNHSCNPSIVRYFVKDTVIVKTVRTIKKGEEINENYGPIFTSMRYKDRQASLLNQYWFPCGCIACTENWPLFENLSLIDLTYKCPNCGTRLAGSNEEAMGLFLQCAKCKKPTSMLKNLKMLQDSEPTHKLAMEMMEKGNYNAAKGILIQLLSLFDTFLCQPFRDYHLSQEGLRKCYLIFGNKTPTHPFHL